MKKTTELQTRVLQSIDEVKFRIQTIEDASEALQFVKKLKEFSAEVESKVKERASEIMHDEDVKQIEADEFVIKMIDPTEVEEFNSRSVIEGLGIDRAVAFLKVSTSALKKYLMKGTKEKAVTWEEAEKCQDGMKKKAKKGYISISKKR